MIDYGSRGTVDATSAYLVLLADATTVAFVSFGRGGYPPGISFVEINLESEF